MDKLAKVLAMMAVQQQKAEERFERQREEDQQRREVERTERQEAERQCQEVERQRQEEEREERQEAERQCQETERERQEEERKQWEDDRLQRQREHEDERRWRETLAEERRIQRPVMKVTPYKDGQDVLNLLETFEQSMRLHKIRSGEWNLHWTGVLSGQIRDACQDVDLSITRDQTRSAELLQRDSRKPTTQVSQTKVD